MAEGYCTVADVRRALRETEIPGDVQQDRQIIRDAIAGQTSRLRELTGKHWYVSGGLDEDPDNLIPTGVRSRSDEEHDIPDSPHPQHNTLLVADRGKYPRRMNGPYTRIRLGRQDADTITALNVRDHSGTYEDWVADSSKTDPDDYRLHVAAGDSRSPSYVELHVGSLPHLSRYERAVRVSYDYGLDSLPQTIRRAHANLAASTLAEEAAIQIPNNAEVYSVESLADVLEQRAMDLLEDTYL